MDRVDSDAPNYDQLLAEVSRLRQRLADLEQTEAECRRAAIALRESVEKYRSLLDDSSDPIFSFNPEGQYQYVNQAFADGVGKKVADIIYKKIWDVFPQDEADKRFAAVKWVIAHGETKVIEVCVPREDGDRYYITTAKPVFDDRHQVASVICISKEITERKRMEEELLRLSTRDILTNLYNRNFFEVEMNRIQMSRLFPVSIVVADMDKLKSINDRFGHSVGDQMIQKTADLLQKSFRAGDIVARIGGDEFGVLLPQTDEDSAKKVVNRLRARLEKDPEKLLKLSIGLATGQEGCHLVEVMRQADDRMYQDKALHRQDAVQPD